MLPNGAGVCQQGTCQLLTCLLGWGNCDADPVNGCERDLTSSDSCGQCDTLCRATERCQLGDRGYVCSSGRICPPGEFDLDDDPENGCEWQRMEAQTSSLQPATLLFPVDRVLINEDWEVAVGTSAIDGERGFVSSRDPAAEVVSLPTPQGGVEDGRARALTRHPTASDQLLVAYPDAIAVITRPEEQEGTQEVREAPCVAEEADATPLRIRQARWAESPRFAVLAAFESAMVPMTTCSDDAYCFAPDRGFGPAEYTRMFYPYTDDATLDASAPVADAAWRFQDDEVVSCAPCPLDTATGQFREDRRCWGSAQCRTQAFDEAMTCGRCTEDVQGCPGFAPVDVHWDAPREHAYIITERGLVVVRDDGAQWRAVARRERPFDGSAIGGGRFFAGAIHRMGPDVMRVFLLHSTGFVRALDVDTSGAQAAVLPAAPDIGIEVSNEARNDARGVIALRAIDAQTVLVMTEARARLVRVSPRSGRRIELELDATSGAEGFFGAQQTERGISVWRLDTGSMQDVELSRTEDN